MVHCAKDRGPGHGGNFIVVLPGGAQRMHNGAI
jgi:hypothetical protein